MNLSDRIRGAARRKAGRLAAVFTLALLAAPAPAQTNLTGRVLRAGAPAPGVEVELHRVTRNTRGPVGRTATGAGGAFAIPLPPAQDTAGFTVFFATATVDGVRYFGPVLHGGEEPGSYRIEVYDTTTSRATADSVRVAKRDVVLVPASDGGWEVAEVVRVENRARRTLVTDAARPLFGIAIPKGSTAFEAGAGSDDSPSAPGGRRDTPTDVVRVGDRVWVSAPLVPGERDFIFRYRLPASQRRATLAVEHATDSVKLYVRQPAPEIEVDGMAKPTPFEAEGERFLLFTAAGLRPGATLGLDWSGPTPAPVDPRWAAVAVTALVLAGGVWLALRRSRTA